MKAIAPCQSRTWPVDVKLNSSPRYLDSCYGSSNRLKTERPINLVITRILRQMRGRSNSYLVQASDGQFYVAKFRDNPKGTRTLVNELLGSLILSWLGLPVAAGVILQLDESALVDGVWPTLGGSPQAPRAQAGPHFGSAFPGDPSTSAVYDYLPRSLYLTVSDRKVFHQVLMADTWLGRSEPRQAIFTRSRDGGFHATFVDNSMLFGGSAWTYRATPDQAWYFDGMVYEHPAEFVSSFSERIAQVGSLLDTHRSEILQLIPEEWLGGDMPALNKLLRETAKRAQMFEPGTNEDWSIESERERLFLPTRPS